MEKEEENCIHSFTSKLHSHKAVNYSFIIVDRELELVYEKVYTGDDAAENFVKTLISLQDKIRTICAKNEEMALTKEDKVLLYFSLI